MCVRVVVHACACVGAGNSVCAGGEFRSVWNEEASV